MSFVRKRKAQSTADIADKPHAGRAFATRENARDALFVFAHQDDEVAACPSLLRELRQCTVWCAYLTDGALSSPVDVRDAESTAYLVRLGVDPQRIVFIADVRGRFADGQLVANLAEAYEALNAWIVERNIPLEVIYAPDWEGGHADHDATHLIALRTASRHGCKALAFSLYNAYRRPKKLFRVADLVPDSRVLETYRIPWTDAVTAALSPIAFPSQRRTWFALGLGFGVRMMLRRTERVRLATVPRIARRPHAGPLLYETLFGLSHESFMLTSREFRQHLLHAVATSAGC